jgi:hypothetical protein
VRKPGKIFTDGDDVRKGVEIRGSSRCAVTVKRLDRTTSRVARMTRASAWAAGRRGRPPSRIAARSLFDRPPAAAPGSFPGDHHSVFVDLEIRGQRRRSEGCPVLGEHALRTRALPAVTPPLRVLTPALAGASPTICVMHPAATVVLCPR